MVSSACCVLPWPHTALDPHLLLDGFLPGARLHGSVEQQHTGAIPADQVQRGQLLAGVRPGSQPPCTAEQLVPQGCQTLANPHRGLQPKRRPEP